MRRTLTVVTVLALLAGACTGDDDSSTTTTTPATPTTTGDVVDPRPISLRAVAPFATFAEIPLLGDDPPYAGPATPTSLDGVLWAEMVPDWARDHLAANGFVVTETQMAQFHEAYANVELRSRQPLFITTDAAYHYWHLAFSKALRDTEQLVLLPILEEFAVRFETRAAATAQALAGTSLAAEADRVVAFAELLVAVLELSDGPFSPEVEAELDLVRAHLDFAHSPTTGAAVDYSLFGPRGHYTRTPELTRYFLAMSSLGLTAFRLSDEGQMRTGLVLAQVVTEDAELTRMWTQVYEPTAFLVGLADDFTPAELVASADSADPDWRDEPDVVDSAFVAATVAELRALRDVAIDPEQASMRVMGARFTLDSFILDQMGHPNVENRLDPSPLDVAATFGSRWAYQRQVEAGVAANFPDYVGQVETMTDLVSGRGIADWAGTVYDAWLYAIQPMWSPHGAAYPDFMRTDAWTAKAHNTGLASYAELKHDTLLYAKQAFAQGETDPPPPLNPRHWVEPAPVVYARLAAVAGLMRDGLGSRDLLADDVDEILVTLIDMYERFERLARDELASVAISAEDNTWLETISPRFELLWLLAGEDLDSSGAITGGFAQSPNDMAALIADIMSNPSEALEVATGYIDTIYVLVPNDEGVFQVARGAVFSYYEFWVPRGDRLTDEEWREMLVAGTQPDRPAWSSAFVVAAP
jgi:hypothetical protein